MGVSLLDIQLALQQAHSSQHSQHSQHSSQPPSRHSSQNSLFGNAPPFHGGMPSAVHEASESAEHSHGHTD